MGTSRNPLIGRFGQPSTSSRPYPYRPGPPRGVRCTSGSMEVTVVWNAPADMRGVKGFRVYKGNESTYRFQTEDLTVRKATVKVAANDSDIYYVRCVGATGLESSPAPAWGSSNTDKYVAAGTSGETSGTASAEPAGWSSEPSGGLIGGRLSRYSQYL
jgi:hypothetical protein